MAASKFTEALRRLLERELRCLNQACRAENVDGPGGHHIDLDENGLAWCRECGHEWYPKEKP